LDRLLTELDSYPGDLPLSDILHLAKNLRTRFLRYGLTISTGDASRTINQLTVDEILPLKAPLQDLCPVGKMRDSYPLAIMRVENLLALIRGGAVTEAVTLLPMTLCLGAVRLETIPRETRSYLLQVSFWLVWKLREMRQIGVDKNPETVMKGTGNPVTVFTSQWTVRFLNTALLLMFCIKQYGELALDRLGTHPEENFFGFVRKNSNDINTEERMMRKIAQTDIAKDAARELRVDQHIHKRVNLGGVHYDDGDQHARMFSIVVPPELNPETIAAVCLTAGSGSGGGREIFQNFVEYLTVVAIAESVSQGDSEKDHEFICGSGSRIMNGFQWHRPPIGALPPAPPGHS
jgi:hypothetical protein